MRGKFTGFADFLDKAELPALNKQAIESLVKAGAWIRAATQRAGRQGTEESRDFDTTPPIIPAFQAPRFEIVGRPLGQWASIRR
ncbi:hypothetical protein [Streptomyces sp. AS58]|uniref:hypothetical protein n=1 Tax=Streptomyces sp. AS58 TaxID=1519489 RepID=UPI000AD010FF|nr:hypothetical protein [Streptomyces sp. AS58]